MIAKFFENQAEFRKWLIKNHQNETELLVGFYKVNSSKPSMTWSQSVDEVLCFGWIDGVRRSIDIDSYSIRFTPRKATSIWSAINIKKIEVLTELGLMQPAGIASFKLRKENKSRIYTHEIDEVHFSDEFEKVFKANEKAWDFFQALAPSYKKVSKNWVMSAKQEVTRIKRLNELIADSMESKNKWKS
ncbi:YdeI/OmpD-associated family protein [Flavobacterium sp. LS1R49]|uniref:YdeI/OmpD-associated family protein n=1 Tax=Flavobacterium shii TaxID=2987687 RepID=A0A9X3C4B1_9FLAO|nr:YdeI/OmpD-associated family protein [Flavobacterium shii]MCV9927224.1 YdeI/OmpD-associated family protein [Flavobacterium shii]